MLARLSMAAAALVLIGTSQAQVAWGSPLTYDFTGNFLPGSTAVMSGPFSGSFTINSNASLDQNGVTITETGSDVSIRIGNFQFENSPQNTDVLAWIGLSNQPNVANPVAADLEGYIRSIGLSFSMLFYNPGSVSDYLNLGNYNFSPGTVGNFELNFQPDGTIVSTNYGTITSIELVSTPEPGSVVVFLVCGAAAMWRWYGRGWRRRTPGAREEGNGQAASFRNLPLALWMASSTRRRPVPSLRESARTYTLRTRPVRGSAR